MGQDSEAADVGRGSLSYSRRNLGQTQNVAVRINRQENLTPLPPLGSGNTHQAVIICMCMYLCVCVRKHVCVCASMHVHARDRGSSGWSLEAPPFQQPMIYRFKEHLTIDHKAFPLPSSAEAGNKAPVMERQAEQLEPNPKTPLQFSLKQKLFLSTWTNCSDMKSYNEKYLQVWGRHFYFA